MTMWCMTAHEPAGQHLLMLRLNLFHSKASDQEHANLAFLSALVWFFVYGCPETVPSISPLSVKSAGALDALRNTALIVAV